jgi:hypothetical protein
MRITVKIVALAVRLALTCNTLAVPVIADTLLLHARPAVTELLPTIVQHAAIT